MKHNVLFACLILICGDLCSQTRFTITFNNGFGKLPTFTYDSSDQGYSVAEARRIFAFVKDSTGIEFRYSYAGCEKRAHAVSLLLKGKHIRHYKIWNFDPSYLSLFNRMEKPTVKSKAGLSPTVSWRYHVAILLWVQGDQGNKPMVIDPALADTLMDQRDWLSAQHATDTYYTYLDPQWYNYASTDKSTFSCNGTPYPYPKCVLGLLTGDFFLNDGISLSEMWVEEALAVNQVGMQLIENDIQKSPAGSDRRTALIALVENMDSLTAALRGNRIPDNVKPYAAFLQPYQQAFTRIRGEWKTKLDRLRTAGN